MPQVKTDLIFLKEGLPFPTKSNSATLWVWLSPFGHCNVVKLNLTFPSLNCNPWSPKINKHRLILLIFRNLRHTCILMFCGSMHIVNFHHFDIAFPFKSKIYQQVRHRVWNLDLAPLVWTINNCSYDFRRAKYSVIEWNKIGKWEAIRLVILFHKVLSVCWFICLS